MLSDKELAESLTDAEVQRRIVEAKNARALLWSQVTERDVFLCGAKWMLEQIAAARGEAQRHADFEAGWRTAAEWARRDDLLADIGSPAYIGDRAEALARGVSLDAGKTFCAQTPMEEKKPGEQPPG